MKRREILYGVNGGLGALAFHSMLQAEETIEPLSSRVAHFPKAKAKRCIFLYMAGGPSHIDTFDPKPKLKELHLKKFKRQSKFLSAMGSGERYYVQSPFNFVRAGKSGIQMCEHWQHLAGVADELCIYRGCQAESINHPTANYHMNTGNRFGGDPAIGSWVTYGLGTENQDLPGYVVLPEVAYPQGGAANWSNGFLPPHFQGTTLRSKGSPILDLHPPKGVTREGQRSNLDLLDGLNSMHAKRHPGHEELASRMESYELAYRMQMEASDAFDVAKESPRVREMYGSGVHAKQCLMARRLVERGVRFVQLWHGKDQPWDSHDQIEKNHRKLATQCDQAIGALLQDLKERGMLEETLVLWGGEFGRTPTVELPGGANAGTASGRDHNHHGFTMWMAGGGVKPGYIHGATDPFGFKAVEDPVHVHDLHATILHLLGFDHEKLTYRYAGRDFRLTDVHGKVVTPLIA